MFYQLSDLVVDFRPETDAVGSTIQSTMKTVAIVILFRAKVCCCSLLYPWRVQMQRKIYSSFGTIFTVKCSCKENSE